MPEAILSIFRALIDAAFKTGGITDIQHARLHGLLDAEQPVPVPAEPVAAEPPLDVPGGTEGTGFDA